MKVNVRYFASLRDRMGRGEESVALTGNAATVADLWRQVSGGKPLPDSTLISVNMEYTGAETALKDGDEVAFFPPVTGG